MKNIEKVFDDKSRAWHEYEKLFSLLEEYASNVQTFMPASTLSSLEEILKQIEDGQYFILLNINFLSQNFEEGRNNHWAGLYVVKSFNQVIKIIYVDPMGRGYTDFDLNPVTIKSTASFFHL